MEINSVKISSLVNTGAEINLIKKNKYKKVKLSYILNVRIYFIGINKNEIIFTNIYKNAEFNIGLIIII